MAAQLDDAVCIRQWDWSETSQVVSLFCRRLGMVRGVAKGSRRPKSPYSGGIEPLTLGQAGVIVRRNAELALITEWDLTDPWRHIRREWRVYLAASYLAELVQHFVRDHDPHPELFDRLLEVWRGLVPGEPVWPVMVRGIWSVLSEAGYQPSVRMDVRTGEPLADARSYVFVPELGGLTSGPGGANGMGGARGAEGMEGWGVRHATVEVLRLAGSAVPDLAEGERAGGGEASVSDAEASERACRLLASYARYVLGVQPRTHGPLFSPGSGPVSEGAGQGPGGQGGRVR